MMASPLGAFSSLPFLLPSTNLSAMILPSGPIFERKPFLFGAVGSPLMLLTKYTSWSASQSTDSGICRPASLITIVGGPGGGRGTTGMGAGRATATGRGGAGIGHAGAGAG